MTEDLRVLFTAVFEPWVIGDGSYPPLIVGMPVNLSFEMSVGELAGAEQPESLHAAGDGEYAFTGTVLATYAEGDPIVAVQANELRFFIEGPRIASLAAGTRITGRGTLVVDYYAWAEYVDERDHPPNLFFDLIVRRIRRVAIPERFISRSAKRKSAPARLPPSEFGEVSQIESMVGGSFTDEFYLLDLETIDQSIPRTFIG